MRITLGSNVEVWTTDAAPPMGAWRAGEVKWGNGHSYIMRWFDGGPDSGRISRKFIRPFPPAVPLPEDLAAGDIVEVLDSGLWKWAEVVGPGADGHRQLDVRIVGSSKVLTADRSVLRVRQVLKEDNVWVVLHKDNEISSASAVPSRPIAGKHVKSKAIGNGSSKFAAQPFKLGKTKRSNYVVDADIVRDVKRFQGNKKKLCAKEEAAARYDDNIEVIDVHPSHYMKKQQQEMIDDEECDVVGTDSNSDDDASSKFDRSSGSVGSESSSSSSGSNSDGSDGEDHQDEAIQPLPSCQKEKQDDDSDDRTESRASARTYHPANEKAQVVIKHDQQEQEQEQHDRVHGLELEAYVSLMKAFHASGSLTWKKEELLSNLRLYLHISSDEHLQVIWRLNGKRKPAGGQRNGHC